MKTLKNWLDNIGGGIADLSENEEKRLSKMLDIKVIFEFVMHKEYSWLSWQTIGNHKNVYSWVFLDNGYAVGFNENPSRGWSFPSEKVGFDSKLLIINKILELKRLDLECTGICVALYSMGEDNLDKELMFEGNDYSLKRIISEIKEKSEIGLKFKDILNEETIKMLKNSI